MDNPGTRTSASVWRSVLERLFRRQGILALAGALLIAAGTWGFIELADEVAEGDTQKFDAWLLLALRQPGDLAQPIGPAWMHEAGRDLTALGGVAVSVLATALAAAYLLMRRKYRTLLLVLAAILGGLVLSLTLKQAFDRPRPDLVPHLSQVYTSSFPSGHSMLSSVIYLTLGALLSRMAGSYRLKLFFIGAALGITFLVGLSRVYLGVHYPTDVLAGWTLGLCWALLCLLIAHLLQQRGRIEDAAQ